MKKFNKDAEERISAMVNKVTINLNNYFINFFKETVINFDDDEKVFILLSTLASFFAYQSVFIGRSRVDYTANNSEEFLINIHEDLKQNSLTIAKDLNKKIFLPGMDTVN
jgi:hypothetical protein